MGQKRPRSAYEASYRATLMARTLDELGDAACIKRGISAALAYAATVGLREDLAVISGQVGARRALDELGHGRGEVRR